MFIHSSSRAGWLLIFGGAAAALAATGAAARGTVLGVAAAISLVLMFMFGRRGP